jgi:hypothetical protein
VYIAPSIYLLIFLLGEGKQDLGNSLLPNSGILTSQEYVSQATSEAPSPKRHKEVSKSAHLDSFNFVAMSLSGLLVVLGAWSANALQLWKHFVFPSISLPLSS